MTDFDILILGAGYSGTALAVTLAKMTEAKRVGLVEKEKEFGPGVAYRTFETTHLLNVLTEKMGAFADQPRHFLEWCEGKKLPGPLDKTFLPRSLYGQYLKALLEGSSLQKLTEEAIDLNLVAPEKVEVFFKSGKKVTARKVVLALGNQRSRKTFSTPAFFQAPWDLPSLRQIPNDASVLILGTGLTAVDCVLSLKAQSHQGPLTLFSRHGLLPQSHALANPFPPFFEKKKNPRSIREIVKLLREETDRAVLEGRAWQPIVDSLRASTPAVWPLMPLKEKQRFLRHLRSYWISFGNRLPPQVLFQIKDWVRGGQLCIVAGRSREIVKKDATFLITFCARGDLNVQKKQFSFLIDATGPCGEYRKVDSTLMQNLLKKGLTTIHASGIGLQVSPHGSFIDDKGRDSSSLFALGPLRRGELWESTAVNEIRNQIFELAPALLR